MAAGQLTGSAHLPYTLHYGTAHHRAQETCTQLDLLKNFSFTTFDIQTNVISKQNEKNNKYHITIPDWISCCHIAIYINWLVGVLGDFPMDWIFHINRNVCKVIIKRKEKNNWKKNSHFDDPAMFIDFYSDCK